MTPRYEDEDYEERRSSRDDGRRWGSQEDSRNRGFDGRGRGNQRTPERDEYGRFVSDEDSGRGRGSQREREYDSDQYYDDRRSRGGTSNRGFASMDPDEQHEIARRGGEASARMQSRDEFGQFEGYSDRGGSERGGSSSRGRGGRFEEENEDRYSQRGSSRRGFASMDPEERREIASRGGRASHQGRSNY